MNLPNKINQVLNLAPHEWPRVTVAWGMAFLSRTGFIIGWSILLAIFISRVGIELLPLLFLSNAVFVMLGTLVYRKWIHRLSQELLITSTVILAGAFLISSIFFLGNQTFVFFVLFLIAESVFLAQLNILLSLFNEELFSPLESQRTFPLIESAETIGGIVGGLTLSLFSSSIPTYKFIILWALLLFFILPLVLRFNPKTMEVPRLEEKQQENKVLEQKVKPFAQLKKIPFLKSLMIIVVLHWAIMNILEFQYSKAIQMSVASEMGNLVLDPSLQENYEHLIAQKLGTLHVIFNSAALLMQLIFASRIIQYLGITSSMLLHPLVTLVNLFWMTFRFNFFTASLTRGSYELTSILFKSAYDSSYYAIPHSLRSDAKELMQGLMKPLGAVLGTVSMIVIAFKLEGENQNFGLNVFLTFLAIFMVILIQGLSKKYTEMSEQNLSHKLDLATRLNAVEILAQKGHQKTTQALRKIFKREREPEILKDSIIHTLGLQEDLESVSTILEALGHPSERIRLSAVEALSHFTSLKKHIMDQSFTRYRVVDVLKARLDEEKEPVILEKLVRVFYQIDPELLISLLMESLKNAGQGKKPLIQMFKLFHDVNLPFYLQEELNSKEPEIRGACIIALWQFKPLRAGLRHHSMQMLLSSKEELILTGLEVSGEIGDHHCKNEIKKFLEHPNKKIQEKAVLALAKMSDETIIPHLLKALSSPVHEWFERTENILAILPKGFRQKVRALHDLNIVEEIHRHINRLKHLEIDRWSQEALEFLRKLYRKINAHHEVHRIDRILDSRKPVSSP